VTLTLSGRLGSTALPPGDEGRLLRLLAGCSKSSFDDRVPCCAGLALSSGKRLQVSRYLSAPTKPCTGMRFLGIVDRNIHETELRKYLLRRILISTAIDLIDTDAGAETSVKFSDGSTYAIPPPCPVTHIMSKLDVGHSAICADELIA
jgi:hypothetical protein